MMSVAPLRIFLSSSVFWSATVPRYRRGHAPQLGQLPIGMEHFSADLAELLRFSTESLDSVISTSVSSPGAMAPSNQANQIDHTPRIRGSCFPKYTPLYLPRYRINPPKFNLFPPDTRDPEHEGILLDFRTYLQQNEVVGFFDSEAELGRQVSISIGRELQKSTSDCQHDSTVPSAPSATASNSRLRRSGEGTGRTLHPPARRAEYGSVRSGSRHGRRGQVYPCCSSVAPAG